MNLNNINFEQELKSLKVQYPNLTEEQIKFCISNQHSTTHKYKPTKNELKYELDKPLKEIVENLKNETIEVDFLWKEPQGRCGCSINFNRHNALRELKNDKEITWLTPLEYHKLEKITGKRIVYAEFGSSSYPKITFPGMIIDGKYYLSNSIK